MSTFRPRGRAVVLNANDGRSREAVTIRRMRAEFTAHIGGNPSATQRAMIERAVMVKFHLLALDEKVLKAAGSMTEHDTRQYLAWTNTLTRLMRDMGMRGKAEKAPSLADHIAARSQ